MLAIVFLVVIGASASVLMLGQYGPIVAIAVVIVGAIAANRAGYKHQAQAIRREMAPTPSTPSTPRAQVADRLAELARLREAGLVTDEEAARRREAILSEL